MTISKAFVFSVIGFLHILISPAFAGEFQPAAGTSIHSGEVTISWTSDAQNQWVRAYGSNRAKIFDSGRQIKASGQVSFEVPQSESRLQVIFYEKVGGKWSSQSRYYTVSISSDGGAGGSGDVLAGLNCSTDEIVRFDGNQWRCASDNDTDFLSEAGCEPGELLRATAEESWECVDAADVAVVEDCPSEYLGHLRTVQNFEEPRSDGMGGVIAISKDVDELVYTRFSSDICEINWGYQLEDPDAAGISHVFRKAVYPDGGLPVDGIFSTVVYNRGLGYEIEVDYHGGSNGDGGTQSTDRSKQFFTVTEEQWVACGRMAGCSFDDY